jgi:hypothetical protein
MFFIKSGNITSKENFIYARQVKEKGTLTYVHEILKMGDIKSWEKVYLHISTMHIEYT